MQRSILEMVDSSTSVSTQDTHSPADHIATDAGGLGTVLRGGLSDEADSAARTPLWGSANPKKRPKPSKNVPNTLYNHNIAQMGMVVHAPKAKNDRIIDLFLVLDPKPYPGGYGPYPKIWDQDMAVGDAH